jgi:hypothetical protein
MMCAPVRREVMDLLYMAQLVVVKIIWWEAGPML